MSGKCGQFGRRSLADSSRKSRRVDLQAALLAGVVAACSIGCRSGLPKPSSQIYREYVSTFYVGLAALQVGDDVRAEKELAHAAELVPAEPTGWANWGILRLRQRDLDAASERLERAKKIAPQNGHIYYLLGLVETGKGRSAEAIADFKRSIELDPKNLIATNRLAEETERQGDANSEAEFQKLMQQIVDAQPNNVAALLELGRVAAKRGDGATLKHVVDSLKSESQSWPPEVLQQFDALQTAALGPEPRTAALRTTYLRNVLMRLPEFRKDLAAIKPQPGDEAQPFTHFLRMETPKFTPAPADAAMHFEAQPLVNPDKTKWTWIGSVSLGDAGAPIVVEANGNEVRLASGARFPFPGGGAHDSPLPESIVPIDFNYDFKTDLVLAGAGGVRFYRQDSPSSFTDVTSLTKLPVAVVNGRYTGAWAVDIEADGDLDIVLGSTTGEPTVLRNNGDGTFAALPSFRGISGVRGFVWADLNGDGNPDAAFIDGGNHLRIFTNQRSGNFVEIPSPEDVGQIKAITAADVSHRGVLDLVAVRSDGAVIRLAEKLDASGWDSAPIAQVPDAMAYLENEVRLHAVDLDNNGAIDLLLGRVSGAEASSLPGALLWLGDDQGMFLSAMKLSALSRVFGVADVTKQGRFDLLGLGSDGQPVQGINQGTKNYRWQIIRPRALLAKGDQRINSFGIGGEIEIRSGLLTQMQPIRGPQVHFGLGEQDLTDVARILWPNGTLRAEFALKANQQVVTEQRLKGSCPFLFAYNGSKLEFVKDAVPWGSAIGLRIDNQGTAKIAATEEWYKISGSQLAPHDGYYDLRVTGELWETYYYDYLSLKVVDHPAGTEVFTDERFVVPAIKPRIIVTDEPHKIARALDDLGNDVTNVVRDLDGHYLDTFGRGQYQGVTRDHYVEVDLGEHLPARAPVYLIASGWLHPSDSSVNVAIGQGSHEPARALSLEVPNGRGGWVVARQNLGFPAGRKKTCVIDISNVFLPGTAHIVRLRTNLEVYWDSIEWAEGRPDIPLRITQLASASADLRYRGYSTIHQASASSPEIPDYNHLTGARQPWRDLEGYYTRYGDVRELLDGVDDRYVIMNAGDEMALRFKQQPPPAPGWVRDYVIAGDGWIKDGDYNSTYSRTVLPLPYHARTVYDTPPGRLEDERVYREHPEDWEKYHTRYVTAGRFLTLLNQGGTQ
jgi:tetratricopeptide (TPR) repeat protein